MTLEKFNSILCETGLPVAYHTFPVGECPDMPFIVYEDIRAHNFGADNKVWHSQRRLQVDLLTSRKDVSSEKKLEDVLNQNDIYWTRESGYDDSEKHFRITYECEV